MATTTPNYGWTVPTSTDLVKDGATAIETLGDAIDASMNTALGTKKAGMVLLNTTSFSGVASQSINDVFSANFENYRIVLTGSISTNAEIRIRYRVSGADNSTANYNFQRLSGSATTVSAARTTGATSQDVCIWDANLSSMQLEIFRPFLTEATGSYAIGAADGVTTQNFAGRFTGATSFTGLTIIASAGTITGKAFVYGYNL